MDVATWTFRGFIWRESLKRSIALTILGIYALFVLDMTLRWLPVSNPPVNLVPFQSIRHDWLVGGRELVVNLVGNVVAFLPFGVLLPRLWPSRVRVWWVVLLGASFSAGVELMQF